MLFGSSQSPWPALAVSSGWMESNGFSMSKMPLASYQCQGDAVGFLRPRGPEELCLQGPKTCQRGSRNAAVFEKGEYDKLFHI